MSEVLTVVHDSTGGSVRAESARRRIPNAERTETTRAALLKATIQAVALYGYAGASSTRIAELSGYTRGAQKHHFASKADLVAQALLDVQARSQEEGMAKLEGSGGRDLGAVLQALWEGLSDELYVAAMELRMAARIDDDLRAALVPAEQEMGRNQREYMVRAFDDGKHARERLLEVSELAVNTLRGMSMQRMLYPDPRREQRQFRVLEETVRTLLSNTG